jgi:hypothetical protein
MVLPFTTVPVIAVYSPEFLLYVGEPVPLIEIAVEVEVPRSATVIAVEVKSEF